ncbi:malto-oligosyltrehalose synthase [Rathayibacter sp. KR2-224]|uniref:malto-oligosyltrehalose synthase n=1 Tax=Rathayibacter sp. KR2-224 TaxID=3400913 RepID=UPI003C0F036A
MPTSTYRLQITSEFTLGDAASLCSYLGRLGVGWVYLSPLLRAEPGSMHGYDVIDHSLIDPERGGAEAFSRVADAARAEGMGILIDIVPNHMGVATPELNAWWWDLLQHGKESRFAGAFDVDWDAADGRIRIPVLGDGDDELDRLRIEHGVLAYYDNRYPIAEGTARDGDSPRAVHDRQHYELVNWRRADAELNYRRFFAVNTLAAIRVEEASVFDESHAEIGRWFRDGLADGLRVDHPDGLADPRGYLDRLAALTGGAPVWVEKILEGDEVLPGNWMTCGTTGYDALGDFDRILVDPRGRAGLERAEWQLHATQEPDDGSVSERWQQLILGTKRSVAEGILRSEVNRLVRELRRNPGLEGTHSDADLAQALIELLAAMPVYRTYLPIGEAHLRQAAAAARAERPDLSEAIDAVVAVLADPGHPAAVRFQQTSGMVMAKGVEDTAFYRFATLTSLNEVGGDPSEFAIDTVTFHERQARRQAAFPLSMTTLSTHDTKRGEDVRARITSLSERPELWAETLTRLHEAAGFDDPVLENLIWQAVVGAWPASRQRLHAYAEKAAREAGTSTNWTGPDAEFEARMHAAIDAVFDDPRVASVIEQTVAAIASAGLVNGLSAKLLQLAAPGIPDVYQGSEFWERSLVDPDNRRPIDFAARAALLERIDDGWLPPLDDSGAAKLLVTTRALRLRREHPERFIYYRPTEAVGAARDHVVAFDRGGVIAVATRLPHTLTESGGWRDTVIEPPGSALVDVLTGQEYSGGGIRLAELLGRYPVALLTTAERADGAPQSDTQAEGGDAS